MVVTQHFLLTAAARSLSLGQVMRLSDEEAHARFVAIRWSDNNGQPYCPHCGCVDVYSFRCRPIWRCKGCNKQFSVTSGTLFHSRKLPIRDYLAAVAIFVNGAKGHADGIGRSAPRHGGLEQALGERPFVDDMCVPGMLHGALVLSEHPRARVVAIRTSV